MIRRRVHDIKAEDIGYSEWKYPDGRVARVFVTTDHPKQLWYTRLEITGDKGAYLLTAGDPRGRTHGGRREAIGAKSRLSRMNANGRREAIISRIRSAPESRLSARPRKGATRDTCLTRCMRARRTERDSLSYDRDNYRNTAFFAERRRRDTYDRVLQGLQYEMRMVPHPRDL